MIVADVAEGVAATLTENAVEVVEKAVSVDETSSSENTEIDSSDGSGSLADNLLGILAEVLIPFLGTLQDLLGSLANSLIGGLIATLKSLLEGLVNKWWFEFVIIDWW